MDLRTKLVFGLVAVSLVSMLALGTLAYTNAEDLIARRSALSLASLAEAKAERVESVVRGWEEAVSLLASRTQLRTSLAAWNGDRSETEQARVARILSDAEATSDLVAGVAAYGIDGSLVASAGVDDQARTAPASVVDADGDVVFRGFTADDPPLVAYAAVLRADSAAVGILHVLLSTYALADVTANRTGLRETGEALIATREENGEIRLLTPRRHAVADSAAGSVSVATARLMREAFDGVEGPITEQLIDYRGEPVWAALRRIEPASLGLVVKSDEAEERADISVYRERLIGVGFSLAAFAILLGVVMGFMFARPIHALALVATRIGNGDLGARADEDREDELGLLGETFNQMSERLEQRLEQLQEFKTFFDESRDMLCIAGTDGFFKRVNPAFEARLGWSEDELLDRPFVDFVHPDDVEKTLLETEQLAQGVPTISFSNRYRCKDGSYRVLEWTAHPDPETGKLYSAARIAEDE